MPRIDVGLAAVDDELQALAHEVVGLLLDDGFQAEQALLAGGVAPLDHLLDELGGWIDGGRNTQGTMRIARFMTASGVCTQIAAMVPTTRS